MSDVEAIREKVEQRLENTVNFLRMLVQAPSVLGAEESAQAIVERRMSEIGFRLRSIEPDAEALATIPQSGVPPLAYPGRRCLIGELKGGGDGVFVLNGHVDVVSPEPRGLWSDPPFSAVIRDGRMFGRGAVDMKGGIAAMLLAIESAQALGPLPSTVVYQSVIEEEASGNGTLAAVLDGPAADVALIAEPSKGNVTLAGVGVVFARITLTGESGHALSSDARRNPIDAAYAVISSLRELEEELNQQPDAAFAEVERPYLLNIGALHSGDWPASSPGVAELDVRLGFPSHLTPEAARQRLQAAALRAEPTAEVEFRGHRAHGYSFDPETPFVKLLRRCHEDVHGEPPIVDTARATTDLRFFQSPVQVAGAACYGPTGDRLHGTDEYVELDSIADVAAVIGLLLRRWRRSTA